VAKNKQAEKTCIWTPTEKQSEFLSSSYDEVLYGGAAGGGKSDSLLIDCLGLNQNALNWSRYRAILFRKTFTELSELVDRSKEIYPSIFPGAIYNTTDHEWRFPSGAKVIFSYMDKDDDRFAHQGREYQYVAWDELTHWASPVCYKYLQSRTRSVNPNIRCYTRATTNPGGRGHAWVKEHWRIAHDGSGTNFVHVDHVRNKDGGWDPARSFRQFIPALLNDNPHLSNSGYREMLMKLPEKDRLKLLDGRWDIVEGQFFTNWDPNRHIVEPFKIPLDWPRWRAMDWGKTRPYSVGWYTIDPDGVIYRYKELYGWGGEPNVGTSESPKMISKKIDDMEKYERAEGVKFRNNPADQSCFHSRGEGITIIELFSDQGILWNPSKGGPNSRVNGWNVVNQKLHDGTLKVFSNCKHLIRTLPSLQVDQSRPEDVDTNMEDHAADELRYALVSRHKYNPKLAGKQRHANMSMDYILELDDQSIEKSIYRP